MNREFGTGQGRFIFGILHFLGRTKNTFAGQSFSLSLQNKELTIAFDITKQEMNQHEENIRGGGKTV
jgi:hypothetical protein